jgi:SAM-dependent methyltransferase
MSQTRTLPDLLQALRGFQESRALLTAIELDLLAACDGQDADGAAAAIGADPRATGMLLNALTALGVLAKDRDRYRLTAPGRDLARDRDGLMHMVHLWETWSSLSECVRSGRSSRQGPQGRDVGHFIAAMHSRARTLAEEAVRLIGARGVRRLLDVGGGPGTFAIAFARAEPQLQAEVLDQAPVLPIALGHIREAGLEGRVAVREGDLRTDPFGQGYDLILLSAICHMLGEGEIQDLLGRCARALAPGGRIAIREFILDEDRAGPPSAALFALNMLVGTERGNAYTAGDYRAWLSEAGFREVVRPDPQGDWIIGRLERWP